MPRFGERPVEKAGETLELQEARVKQHYTEGMKLRAAGKQEEARIHFQRTLQDVAFERDILGSARFSALRKVRGLCFKQLSHIAKEQGDKATALQRLGDALALDDSDVVMWHDLGCLALDVGRLNVARCAFERGLQLRPRHPLFLDKLCEVTYRIGDFAACLASADLLLTLAPEHPRGLVFKGLVLRRYPATEDEGSDVLESAREAEGGLGQEEVDRLRDFDRKRVRRDPAAAAQPRAIVLTSLNWRNLLEGILSVLPSSVPVSSLVSQSSPAMATSWQAPHLNQLCILSVETTMDEKEGAAEGGEGEERVFEDAEALCKVCAGDIDPGYFPGDDLLLCENFEKCGQAYHTTCLSSPLKQPPGEDEQWFCFKCNPRPQKSDLTGLDVHAMPPAQSTDIARNGDLPIGNGGESQSPSKRRRSNLPVASAPSRKSGRRQSQADAEKRPAVAQQLGRILDLVAEGGPEEAGEDDDAPSPIPVPQSASSVSGVIADMGETLSRYDIALAIGSVGRGLVEMEEQSIRNLLKGLTQRSICLLEILHKVIHVLASAACEVRLRGKVLDMALDLDAAVRESLTYSPEASLFFAELNLDRYEANLTGSSLLSREQNEAATEDVCSQNIGVADDSQDEEGIDSDQAQKTQSKSNGRYMIAYEFHMKGLWRQHFSGWRHQARYLWLLARCALCHQQPWNALGHLEDCAAIFTEANADAPAAGATAIYLPSCQLNNCITVEGINRRLRRPQQLVRDLMLDQQVQDLDLAFASAQQTLTDKQGTEDEHEAQQQLKSTAMRTVRTLSPFLIKDAEQNGWLVTTLSTADNDTWRRTEKHLEQLRIACIELTPDCFKQEVYILNVMLAEVVRVKNVLTEKRDDSLYFPLDSRLLSKGGMEGAPKFGVDATLNIVSDMVSREKERIPELCGEDENTKHMLHQIEVQVARLTCRLGCSRERKGEELFHKSLLLFYKVYMCLRPGLDYECKFEILHMMFEELIRRNVHGHRGNHFMRIYLAFLHGQRRKLETEHKVADNEQQGDNVSGKASVEPKTSLPRCASPSAVSDDQKQVQDEQEEGDNDGDEVHEKMSRVMQELAKCYYAMLGLKARQFRSEYEWVDKVLNYYKEEDDRGGNKSKDGMMVSACCRLTEKDSQLALDLWDFVKPLAVPKTGGKGFKGVSPVELKDILKTILDVLGPSREIFVFEKSLTNYLSPFTDRLPTFQDLLPDFSATLAALPVQGVEEYLATVSFHMSDAKKAIEERKYSCLKDAYFLLAQCNNIYGNEDHTSEKIQNYLWDLYIDPRRKESWIGLADSYEELLQTSSQFGIRYRTTLEHSKHAQIIVCNCLQAYSAVLSVANGDAEAVQDANKKIGVMLYLLVQGTRTSSRAYPVDWYKEVVKRAYDKFNQARDPLDWTVEYYQGKLIRKLALSQPIDAAEQRSDLHQKSLEHFYMAAVQNTEDETSTLCIDALYKLHSTRAKLLVNAACDNAMLERLERYSLAQCMERAKREVGEGKRWDKCNIDVTKGGAVTYLAKAEREQADFEAAIDLQVSDGDDNARWRVFRDCMLASRVAILKNRKFSSSKPKFLLAWLMECALREFPKTPQARTAVSVKVVELLEPLFFNSETGEILSKNIIEGKFSNYLENSEECIVASFSNLNSFIRTKIKIINLFVTHLRALGSSDELTYFDRIEKLVEFLLKAEKIRMQGETNKKASNPQSLKPAIVRSVHVLFDVLQELALGDHRKGNEVCSCDHSRYPLQVKSGCAQGPHGPSKAAEFALHAAGKLRSMLQEHMDLFDYLRVDVDERLRHIVAQQPTQCGPKMSMLITLADKRCPLNSLLHIACRVYCNGTKTTYYETSENQTGNKCMECAMTRWKEFFRTRKLTLQSRPAVSTVENAPAKLPGAQTHAASLPSSSSGTLDVAVVHDAVESLLQQQEVSAQQAPLAIAASSSASSSIPRVNGGAGGSSDEPIIL